MSASDLNMLVGTTSTRGCKGPDDLVRSALLEFVDDPVVHGDLLLGDLGDFFCKCGVVAQVDVVQDLNAIGIAPQFIPDAVGLQEVIGDAGSGLHEVDQQQSNDDRCHGGEQVGHHGFDAEPAQLGRVTEAGHARHDAEQHQGNSNELEDIDENVTKGLDVVYGKVVPSEGDGHPGVEDTDGEADEDLPVQGEAHAFQGLVLRSVRGRNLMFRGGRSVDAKRDRPVPAKPWLRPWGQHGARRRDRAVRGHSERHPRRLG